MLSLKIEKQKFKWKRLKTFWPKIAKLSGPKLRILKRKTGRTWEYGPVQPMHRSEKAAKAWAVFSFTHVSRIWPNALWVIHLGSTARHYSREIKIAPEGTLPTTLVNTSPSLAASEQRGRSDTVDDHRPERRWRCHVSARQRATLTQGERAAIESSCGGALSREPEPHRFVVVLQSSYPGLQRADRSGDG
jgi:hypothetical protein